MSGIEIAGLVLGAFPLLIKCLNNYQEGFEPLEEWWSFRTAFIAFVDDISHQMMRYHENLLRLLDPIISDTETLQELIANPSDSRWQDGTLDTPLQTRLANQSDRFLRIIYRMKDTMTALNKLLQIEEDGQTSWIGKAREKPWQWHFQRLRISFDKGKHKKVKKLAVYNQEIQEILGYSERVIPIADKRNASKPVKVLEDVRKHAQCAYGALQKRWLLCEDKCPSHEAHLSLRSEAVEVRLNLLFVMGSTQNSPLSSRTHEIITQPCLLPRAISLPSRIQVVQNTDRLAEVQKGFQEDTKQERPKESFVEKTTRRLRSLSLKKNAAAKTPEDLIIAEPARPEPKKSVSFSIAPPAITATDADPSENGCCYVNGEAGTAARQPNGHTSTPTPIFDLCRFLRDGIQTRGQLENDLDAFVELRKAPTDFVTALPRDARFVSLPRVLEAYHKASLDLSRQTRFEMAAHIASALLTTHLSPWLSARWTKNDFYFLVDTESQTLCRSDPFVSRGFQTLTNGQVEAETSKEGGQHPIREQQSEEEARSCLFTLGVIILELIFGHNIEDCSFRKDYYGRDDVPNDQTDVSTARRWANKVLGESGPNIADVVRRCLDCAFGPRPCFDDVRFRESVFEGVIKPLASYSRVWPEVMP